ncbi:ABC transporter related [Alkaliphilus metalliredigens QYMF]|uniref:ABC transporter related n=1 Tax=Alkaliphilus metalliredigens (strain QYMF) TaxID=293826 RepID=A6TK78_ALKMQ|nr:ABC transporter ATP-binding protein [Alkaliphilus metalliredigens]ABR46596.1 ABC transporter related [Alkaliphilus metalliredigens QYMF]
MIKKAIELKNVRKVYRVGEEKVIALNDISFSVDYGEVCCLLGTSGSGKSTLLNMMAGLEKPTRGQVIVNGRHVEKMDENRLVQFRQKNIGFVFQSYNLLPTLTAIENVSLPLTFRGVNKKIRERLAVEMLEAVGLKTHIKHKPTQMSGGQQQRVGIARAFVTKAPIIFADEPTGNLDSKTTDEVLKLMLRLVKENNQALVLVTHDKGISKFAHKVYYMLDGNIEKVEVNSSKMGG